MTRNSQGKFTKIREIKTKDQRGTQQYTNENS